MKKLMVVLGALLAFPVVAEIAPVGWFDEISAENDSENVSDTQNATVATAPVVAPVAPIAQPQSRTTSARNVATGRAPIATAAPVQAGRGAGVAASRGVSARTAVANPSLNTRATTARNSGVNTATSARAATRTNAVSARSAATPVRAGTPNVAARAATTGSVLYNPNTASGATARVGVRGSSAIRSGTTIAATAAPEDMLQKLDRTAQTTDLCKASYMKCMDDFCNTLDDNQGRCSCSDRLKTFAVSEQGLRDATLELERVARDIQLLGYTTEEIETMYTAAEAENAMRGITDNTQFRTDLENIMGMIVPIKAQTSQTANITTGGIDLSNMLNFSFDTDFDLNSMFGGATNTTSIANTRGVELYKTATARCKPVLDECSVDGINIAAITNSYDLEIDKQCIVYERSLDDANTQMQRTIANAENFLRFARLQVASQKNQYDLRGCINALDTCMQDDYVCGNDFEGCLDPTGKYIVNGEIVVGSTPGALSDIKETGSNTGLYATWDYNALNAWAGTGEIAAYITSSIGGSGATTNNIARYLKDRIGSIDSKTNVATGMCANVYQRCQRYTYGTQKNAKFNENNTVLTEFLTRALPLIKSRQDAILEDFAQNCRNDVNSCLAQNQSMYGSSTSSQNVPSSNTLNACRNIATTCASAVGALTTGYDWQDFAKDAWNTSNSSECPENSHQFAQCSTESADGAKSENDTVACIKSYVSTTMCACVDGYEIDIVNDRRICKKTVVSAPATVEN